MLAKVLGEFQEGRVFPAHVVKNPDCADFPRTQPDDLSPRAAELSLQGLHLLDGRVEMLLEKVF
jgi:hypothetical protein